ncbi:hypothetical protein PEC18_10080 [Paucibacter sp. O1-1]|nr:hypothetical protein [Paucibacter sp. O1-1]MDA3826192.1 hypothetical protein [Paucibacter sp. O1-1]
MSGNAEAMKVKTSDVTLDFILMSATRVMRKWRWWDLVRPEKLVERVKKHNLESAPNIQFLNISSSIPTKTRSTRW